MPHQLIIVIDMIIKEVQGDYIHAFQEKMNYLFPLVWQRTNVRDEKIRLLKIFKIWHMFFNNKSILIHISNTLNLAQAVSSLITSDLVFFRNLSCSTKSKNKRSSTS